MCGTTHLVHVVNNYERNTTMAKVKNYDHLEGSEGKVILTNIVAMINTSEEKRKMAQDRLDAIESEEQGVKDNEFISNIVN
jgi:hypothetical protein